MKAITALLLFLFSTTCISAQIQKGNLLYGGNFGFNNIQSEESRLLNVYISPTFGRILSSRFIAGTIIDVNLIFEVDQNSSSFGVSPFARAYFNKKGTTRGFFQIQTGLQSLKSSVQLKIINLSFGLSLGADFLLNEYVAIECALGFRRSEALKSGFIDNTNINTFGFNIGIVTFVNRPKRP